MYSSPVTWSLLLYSSVMRIIRLTIDYAPNLINIGCISKELPIILK